MAEPWPHSMAAAKHAAVRVGLPRSSSLLHLLPRQLPLTVLFLDITSSDLQQIHINSASLLRESFSDRH
jgi:hypothetical protein